MKKILGASLIDGIFSSSICKYNAPHQETRWYLYICETIYKTLESKIISRLFLSRLSRSNLLFTFPPPPKVKPSNLYFPYLRNIYILDLHKKKKIYEIPSIEHRSLLTIFDAVIEIFRETRAEILTRNRNSLRVRILLCDSSHCTDCVRYR